MICEFCEIDSGRTHAKRECCLLRLLAKAPKHILLAYVKNLSEEEKIVLREKIKIERKRLLQIKIIKLYD